MKIGRRKPKIKHKDCRSCIKFPCGLFSHINFKKCFSAYTWGEFKIWFESNNNNGEKGKKKNK